jgi:hypothetical protein
MWKYVEATPQNAAVAIAVHDREFSDWSVDEQLVALAMRVYSSVAVV